MDELASFVQSQIDLKNSDQASPQHTDSHAKDLPKVTHIVKTEKSENVEPREPVFSSKPQIQSYSKKDSQPFYSNYVPLAARSRESVNRILTFEPLARCDFVSSGLYQFDNKPGNYRAWYSSFNSAVSEVRLKATQELNLMTKWLGKESSEQFKRLRSVHVGDPQIALNKAWGRLCEFYAAPEIIERSLFQRP